MSERNQPLLQPNELCIKSFLPGMWMMELSVGLRRKIRTGPREDKLQLPTATDFLNVHGIRGAQPGIPDVAVIYLDFP